MQTNIFRKVALDRLSSPEQLDQVMETTDPRGWIALAALALLLATAIAWGFLGELPDRVAGAGILTKTGGVLEVVSPNSGRVTDVSVRVGEIVSQGQVVAWVDQPALFAQLQQARMSLETLRRQQSDAASFGASNARLQSAEMAEQRANGLRSIEASEQTLKSLQERLRAQDQLVQQGLLTRSTLLQTQQQYDQTREKLESSRADLTQLQSRFESQRHDAEEQLRSGQAKIDAAAAQVAQLERDFKTASQVTSPYTGRVLELMTEPGKIVGTGEPVLSLDRAGREVQDLEAVIYVPASQGKRIRTGMAIQVAPSTVRQEEFGMMLGTVTFVSSYPATSKGMMRVLKNEQLVQSLQGQGSPYEVHAQLVVDPSTESHYRWSSSHGPPTTIQSGTVANAQVIVETQRPIAQVIPLLRKWTGV
jgi:HlyD family secretion protein